MVASYEIEIIGDHPKLKDARGRQNLPNILEKADRDCCGDAILLIPYCRGRHRPLGPLFPTVRSHRSLRKAIKRRAVSALTECLEISIGETGSVCIKPCT